MKIQPARGLVLWWLNRTGFGGITLPPMGIYLRAERFDDVRLRRHESVHWRQYREMGLIRFYVVYLYWLARIGYEQHPMEIAARAAERDSS